MVGEGAAGSSAAIAEPTQLHPISQEQVYFIKVGFIPMGPTGIDSETLDKYNHRVGSALPLIGKSYLEKVSPPEAGKVVSP